MLFGSNRSNAPRSDSASVRLARASRSERSLPKSIRCSQSTAIVAPRDAMFVVTCSPVPHCRHLARRFLELPEERDEILVAVSALDRGCEECAELFCERQHDLVFGREIEHEADILEHQARRERGGVV